MRRDAVLLGAMLAMVLVVPAPTQASPVWDWQATYEYDANGEVLSRSLDAQSTSWLECTGTVTNVLHTVSSTDETRAIEIVRMDTANRFIERVRYENGEVVTDRWSCVGSQIPLPGYTPSTESTSCKIRFIGACSFDCNTNGRVHASITNGIRSIAHGQCVSTSGGSASCGSGIIGSCSASQSRIGLSAAGQHCELHSGIVVEAECKWTVI